MDYPQTCFASTLGDNVGMDHQKAADLGSTNKWTELVEFLKDRQCYINSCRLPVDKSSTIDFCTPLHYAAKGGAPKDVFEELIKLGASKTLKDINGKTAYDIGKRNGLPEDVLTLIEVPYAIQEKESEIQNLESGLHKVILGRAENLVKEHGLQLPQVAFMYEFGEGIWYPVPMMYGGFNISMHDEGIEAVSFCRVVGGSGQRHVINIKGEVELVEDGLY